MENLFSLKNKKILVTGSYGHLGTQISIGLANAGAHVILNGRNEAKLKSLQDEIKKNGHDSSCAVFDVCNEYEVKGFFTSHPDLKLSGLVNNASAGRGGTLMTANSKDYFNSYEIVVVAAANLIKYGMNNFEQAVSTFGEASIVNISSMYGLLSPHFDIYESPESTNPPFYGAAKAALVQLTKYSAIELAKKNIRVNSITPGPFPSITSQTDKAFIQRLVKLSPMNRIGQPEEMIGAVQFLLSGASSYVTGINIPVDGGWTAW